MADTCTNCQDQYDVVHLCPRHSEAHVAELEKEIEARKLLCLAYRTGNHKAADRALTMLEKLGRKS